MSSQTWWYIARSGGIVAWALLALSVFWGVALSSRFLGKKPKPNWMLDLHRFIGGLSVVFTAIHVVALIADSFVTITVINVLVPLSGNYQRGGVAWGIIAMYLLVAVEVTSLLRKRLSKRVWRTIHSLSFPLFFMSTVHLLLVGTDRTTLPLRVGVLLTVAVVCVSTMIRVVKSDGRAPVVARTPS
ncbi:MAG: ferric reductase-like transmembrane domain-containing protein [Ilumatobacteraceae bacterium]